MPWSLAFFRKMASLAGGACSVETSSPAKNREHVTETKRTGLALDERRKALGVGEERCQGVEFEYLLALGPLFEVSVEIEAGAGQIGECKMFKLRAFGVLGQLDRVGHD
jgi:hypothetical protein